MLLKEGRELEAKLKSVIMACRPTRLQFFQRAFVFFEFLARLGLVSGRRQFLIVLELLNGSVD